VPLTAIQVVGTVHDDVTAIGWEIASAPLGSAAQLDSSEVSEAGFTPDLAGRYRLRFSGTLTDGSRVYCDTVVLAFATEALRVELSWNGPRDDSCDDRQLPPGCDHTDLDLHLLNANAAAWFDDDNDCFWKTCVPPSSNDWGAPGADDDPQLDLDDRRGFGPENINVTRTGAAVYDIGVHAFEGLNSRGEPSALATVRVFCGPDSLDPTLVVGPVAVRTSDDPGRRELWHAATVALESDGTCNATPVLRSGRARILDTDDAVRQR